ncbi:MAG TPA: endo-1,4-beta-xylanase [Bryobacteraceae bacterium]|nr:endo-1,4-beta-xylanase [Bryobacteraceae bacterium]
MWRCFVFLIFCTQVSAQTLGQAGAQRALLMGAAADGSDESSDPLARDASYASTLATQYNMLEAENAMKWASIHPQQNTYNFAPGDELLAFAQAHNMVTRGHNLCWWSYNPTWIVNYATTATPAQMSTQLQNHITTVVTHYRGKVFAWDVVNEAISDSQTGSGTVLKDSIWYNQPGIGPAGTGYVEQVFRWAHAADPNALLFYNEYNIEAPGAKFNAMMVMLKDFVSRGVPIHGVGIQMHITTSGYPSSAGLAQNIQQITALGLQVHITEMDVRVPVDSGGNASASDLQAQAATYQRILTVCLQNPGCTAFQTWGFTDKHSWIPSSYPGYGAALPFDANYQAKPAVASIINAMQTVPPVLNAANIVNAASCAGGGVAPGELVTIFQSNYGPGTLAGTQLDSNGNVSSNLSGTQVFFDSVAAPVIYALAGQVSVVVPYEVSGKQQTVVQYSYYGVMSNSVTVPVVTAAPGIFSADASGTGPGAILNLDYTLNSASNPVAGGGVVVVFATGGGTVQGGANDGAPASGTALQTLPVKATIGGAPAAVGYAGLAPGLVDGVMQVNLTVPSGLTGAQPLVVMVGNLASQSGISVAVK